MKILFITVLINLFFSTKLFAETTIHITNGEWEPYLSQYSFEYGIDSHVVSEAFKLEGIKVVWGFFPWKRSYQQAKHGEKWDASCCWWPTNKTTDSFHLSDIIRKTSFVFFHLKSYKFDWESINDLREIIIGGTLGYDYGEEFMEAVKVEKLKVEYVYRDEINFKKLLAGRI